MKESLFNIKLEKNGKYIIYNSLSSGMIALNKDYKQKFFELSKSSFEKNAYEDLKKELIKGSMIVDNSEDEISKLELYNSLSKFDNSFLSLTIAPTMKCNFDCIYCYEKGYRNNSMNEEVVNKTIDYIKNNIFDKKGLNICWYGGEPLLAIKEIEYIYNHIVKYFPKEFHYNSHMVTNGYLLNKKMAQNLKSLQVNNVQITLDGDKYTHDKRRYLINKQGTFDVILNNIKEVCDIIKISIRVNVDKTNENTLSNIMKILGEDVLKKVNIYIAPVDNINDTFENSLCMCNEEFSKVEINFIKDLLAIREGISIPPVNISGCGANSCNSFVLDPLGDLYKCWNHIGQEKNKVGSLKDGIFINETYKKFVLKDNLDKKCKSCNILPLCYGGCSDKYRDEVKIEQRCRTYKYNINEYINLFIESKLNTDVV
ncbi:radical SAM protein [Clostridium sp.]|uniref:radical SAM/SPASM domain-containing protein n=1 Tax=Clostridium sp. TaxID=1506 RepID=UPI00346396C8